MPPPMMVTSWRKSVMSGNRSPQPCSLRNVLRTNDQGHGSGRLMNQCTGRAAHSDGVGAGLCALLLAANASTPCTPAITSRSPTRREQESHQQQEHESGRHAWLPTPFETSLYQKKTWQQQPQGIKNWFPLEWRNVRHTCCGGNLQDHGS